MKFWKLPIIVAALVAASFFIVDGANPLRERSSPLPSVRSDASGFGSAGSASARNYLQQLQAAENRSQMENPLRAYQVGSNREGRNRLDEMYARGIPRTAQSVLELRSILSRNPSGEEKIALARLLGSLYSPDNITGQNADILLDLRQLTTDPDKLVARSAVFTYSRLGYFNDVETVLQNALKQEILEEDDYYGELAHLSTAPSLETARRQNLLTSIVRENNTYAVEILMDSTARENALGNYSKEEIAALAGVFAKNEPNFPSATSQFGLGDAVNYATWLRATAKVNSALSGGSADELIVAKLQEKNTDPRKVIGYLISPEATPILSNAKLGSPTAELIKTAQAYANQFPTSAIIQQSVAEISSRAGRPMTQSR